jgi:propionyl-CoA carboxylase alpha chain
VTRYVPPAEDLNVRVDTGLYEGGEVSMFYDPMIAKVITYGHDRTEAIDHMGRALDGFCIRGIQHNIPFLAALMAHPRFADGRLTTGFIAEEFPDGFSGRVLDGEVRTKLLAVAAAIHHRAAERNRRISGQIPAQRSATAAVAGRWVVRYDRTNAPAAVTTVDGGYEVAIEGKVHRIRTDWAIGDPLFDGTVDGSRMVVQVDAVGIGHRLFHSGAAMDVQVLTPRAADLSDLMPIKLPPDMSKFLLSPMPGLLVSLAVELGQEVHAGEPLAVVEAMKMENTLRAERSGRVTAIHAAPGDSLGVDQKIIEFD